MKTSLKILNLARGVKGWSSGSGRALATLRRGHPIGGVEVFYILVSLLGVPISLILLFLLTSNH